MQTIFERVDGNGGAGTMVGGGKKDMFGGIGAIAEDLGGSFASFGGVVGGLLLIFLRSENVFGARSWCSFGHCVIYGHRDVECKGGT